MQRLRVLSHVCVCPPLDLLSRWRHCFDCHAVDVLENSAVLEPMHPDRLAWLPECMSGAMVSFRAGAGVVALKGAVERTADPPRLRFTVNDGVFVPRRRAIRAPIAIPVRLRAPGGQWADGFTVNASTNGLLVATAIDAAEGDVVTASLAPTDPGPELVGTARVVRRDEGWVALELRDQQCQLSRHLGRLVADYHRAILHSANEPTE